MDKFINKIIQGDCLEVMKQMPDKSVDLVLTDPPYGIGIARNGKIGGGNEKNPSIDWGVQDWDVSIPEKEYFDEIFRVSKNQIIWGGNYMTKHLPPKSSWIIWDKRCGVIPERTFADGEMCWTSFGDPMRIFRFIWDGMLQQDMKNKEHKFHPTMKPIELMKYCLERYSKEGEIILDPFGGSCTTAVACKQLKRNYICIEKEEKYINICHQRLEATTSPLF